jgi:hypothetical protein
MAHIVGVNDAKCKIFCREGFGRLSATPQRPVTLCEGGFIKLLRCLTAGSNDGFLGWNRPLGPRVLPANLFD